MLVFPLPKKKKYISLNLENFQGKNKTNIKCTITKGGGGGMSF